MHDLNVEDKIGDLKEWTIIPKSYNTRGQMSILQKHKVVVNSRHVDMLLQLYALLVVQLTGLSVILMLVRSCRAGFWTRDREFRVSRHA